MIVVNHTRIRVKKESYRNGTIVSRTGFSVVFVFARRKYNVPRAKMYSIMNPFFFIRTDLKIYQINKVSTNIISKEMERKEYSFSSGPNTWRSTHVQNFFFFNFYTLVRSNPFSVILSPRTYNPNDTNVKLSN